MVLYLGFDDTDSPTGMCTTYLALEVVRLLRARGLQLIGFPRLVRLNPNIPWKTRGNGALCLRVGRGRGPGRAIGFDRGSPIVAYPGGRNPGDGLGLLPDLEDLFLRRCELQCPNTHPAFFLTRRRPPSSLYWRAVRTFVDPAEVLPLAKALGDVRLFKEGRGIVGAAAAVSWRPRDRTYEVLAYRHPERWGTDRRIEARDVALLDDRFPSTFNNFDHRRGRIALAPHTPCPVLLGIRGDDPAVLPSALASLGNEGPEAWLLFETNQGTDDHIQVKEFGGAAAMESIRTSARVVAAPHVLIGGHVRVILDDGKPFAALAYEPSKEFRRVVRALVPGDRVVAWGSVRAEPRGLNLEKLQVQFLAPRLRKVTNPRCPACGRAMKSVGFGQGFRCPTCRMRAPRSAAIFLEEKPAISPGVYEPPVCARRHISKPVKRLPWASPPPAEPSPRPPPLWTPPGLPGLRPAAQR